MPTPKRPFTGYGTLLRGSWSSLWQRPVVFVPLVYRVLGYLLIISSMFLVVRLLVGRETLTTDLSSVAKLASLAAVFLPIIFFEFHVKSFQVAIFSSVAARKSIGVLQAFRQSLVLYGRVAGSALLFIGAGVIVFVIVGSLFLMSAGLAGENAWLPLVLILVGLIALGGFLLALFFSAWMLFWMPVIGYTRESAAGVPRRCWRLLWRDGRHVWITYLISLGVSIGIAVVLNVIPAVVTGVFEDSPLWWVLVFFCVNVIVESVRSAWMMLFTFSSFFKRYGPKVV